MVDELLSVSPISSSLEGVPLGLESALGTSKLEGPDEVVGFLEVRADGVDLVDEVINGADAVLAQDLVDSAIGFEGDSLPVDFAKASLEDELLDALSGGVAVGDVGLNSSEHIDGSFIDSDEDSVVELSQPEQSHDSDDLGVELVDTSDSGHKGDLGFGRYVDLAGELGLNRSNCTFLLAEISSLQAFW